MLVELGWLITEEGCVDLGGEICFDVRGGGVGLEGFGGIGKKLAVRLGGFWRGVRAGRGEEEGLGVEEWRTVWKEIMEASELFWLEKL